METSLPFALVEVCKAHRQVTCREESGLFDLDARRLGTFLPSSADSLESSDKSSFGRLQRDKSALSTDSERSPEHGR